jgi:hypothetical protein
MSSKQTEFVLCDNIPYHYRDLKATHLTSGELETEILKVSIISSDLNCQRTVNCLNLSVRDKLLTPLKLMSGNKSLVKYETGLSEYEHGKFELIIQDDMAFIDFGLNTFLQNKTKNLKSSFVKGVPIKPYRPYCFLLPFSTLNKTGICRVLFKDNFFQISFDTEEEGEIYVGNQVLTLKIN